MPKSNGVENSILCFLDDKIIGEVYPVHREGSCNIVWGYRSYLQGWGAVGDPTMEEAFRFLVHTHRSLLQHLKEQVKSFSERLAKWQ